MSSLAITFPYQTPCRENEIDLIQNHQKATEVEVYADFFKHDCKEFACSSAGVLNSSHRTARTTDDWL